MNVEVVAVGSELLLGQIVDTNSSWIGEQLAAVGINSHYQTKVGDNPARIRAVLEAALDRSDAVICCGGLGPTQDDLTREVIAEVMGVDLVFDQAIADTIAEMFARRGRPMPDRNLRQAMVPIGASPLPQQPGTAPGLCCPISWPRGSVDATDRVIYAVPGVPYEMKEMVEGFVLGDLVARSGEPAVIRSRVLRTWGTSESALAERLAERIDELDRIGNPTLAFLASGVEGLKVRITAKAVDEAAAEILLDAEEQALWPLIGELVFARDGDNMEAVVVRRLIELGLNVAVAESVTGGYLAGRLSLAAGAEAVVVGGVTLGVAPDDGRPTGALNLDEWPPEAEPRAVVMAEAVREQLGADIGLAIAAGVGADGLVAPGTSTLGLAVSAADGAVASEIRVPADAERLRQFAIISLLDLLRRILA